MKSRYIPVYDDDDDDDDDDDLPTFRTICAG